ncbi:hypothetical protein ECPA45_0143, partial [Escherichia coli PA45]
AGIPPRRCSYSDS